jgi:hypothetical protein
MNQQRFVTETTEAADMLISEIKKCLKNSVLDSIQSIEKEAHKRHADFRGLSTTLILVIHGFIKSKHIIGSLQVGDGTVALKNSGNEIHILGKADHGTYAGESVFLTSSGIKDELENRTIIFVSDDVSHIAAMTDGIADDYFPVARELQNFFREMERGVLNTKDPVKALEKWIRYDKKGSYDDRTLVMMAF